jgi:glycosyltransferase involved in cell wall biosynthesis
MSKDNQIREGAVTVITPTYNRADFLVETIESVLSQDCELEYIVLDDGSVDRTLELLAPYKDKLTIFSHVNMGETRTVNKGLQMAHGEFVMIVNSDDPLRPGAIKTLVSALQAAPLAVLAYPDWDETDVDGKTLKSLRLPDYTIDNMLREFNVALGPGIIFRRTAIEKIGLRNEKKRYGGDVDLLFRAALIGPFVHVPQLLATHRVHSQSASNTGRGWQMANEVADFGYDVFNSGKLNAELVRDRNEILLHIHIVTWNYCGNSIAAKIYHRLMILKFFLLIGFKQPKKLMLNIYELGMYQFPSFMKFLRQILPASAVNMIRKFLRALRNRGVPVVCIFVAGLWPILLS